MPLSRKSWIGIVLTGCAGMAVLVALIVSIGVVLWVSRSAPRAANGVQDRPGVAQPGNGDSNKRFTLRLGQGFRFKEEAVVRSDNAPDILFKYLPPQVGGMALRYNPISKQVERGLEPTLTSPVPLLLSSHIRSFDTRPDIARITSGDIAAYFNQAPISSKTRYLLLMNPAGEQFLLTLEQLEAVAGKYDDWHIGLTWERVQLPVGLPGGKISSPLPGRLIFRDWYRSKMIVRVELLTGKEEAIADGTLPSVGGDRLLGYGDSSSAYVVRDAAGKILHTIRFNEQVLGPVLSPDGSRLLATVYRTGPAQKIGSSTFAGASTLSVAVFDLAGRELFFTVGYDDAAWTPDGKIIATGKLSEPGLFEINPDTRTVTAIDATLGAPYSPCVSPSGKTIAFVTGNKVWLIDRNGKNLRQLLPDGREQQRPAFSPDGTKIAFIVCNQLGVSDSGEVFVIDLSTQEVTPVRTNMGVSLVPDTTTRLNWIP